MSSVLGNHSGMKLHEGEVAKLHQDS